MKKKLLLTAALGAASMALADLGSAEVLPPLTIQDESSALPWLLEARPELTDVGFADQLRRFSGFTQTSPNQIGSIEGAPSRFTALFWEGMSITDATGIDRQATFVNTLLLSGDRIRLAQGAVQPLYGRGGSGAILISQDPDAASRITFGGSNKGERFQSGRVMLQGPVSGYLAAESRFSGGYTAYAAEAGKLDTDSEKDESRSISYRGVVHIPATDKLQISLKALDATAHSEYDGGWPIDPDDTGSFWDTRLAMQGYEALYAASDRLNLQAGLHRQHNRREDSGNTRYSGDNQKTFLHGHFVESFAGASIGVEALSEEARIVGQLEGKNRQNDLFAALWMAAADNRIDLSVRQVRFDPDEGSKVEELGYLAAWRYGFEVSDAAFEVGLSTARAVQPPSLVQQLNPYGAANLDLKTEQLEQKRLNLGASLGMLQLHAAAFQTEIEEYINWVNNDLDWTASRYENVDRVSFKGHYLHIGLQPIDGLLIYADQTRLFDHKSSADSLKDRQSDRITTAGAAYQHGALTLAYDLRVGSGYTDGASGERLSGESMSSLALGYETQKGQSVQLSVKNLQDRYRESAYGYTPAVPERTFYLALEQRF